eukprot:2654840-Ditylum_brightwellii.AAC.1
MEPPRLQPYHPQPQKQQGYYVNCNHPLMNINKRAVTFFIFTRIKKAMYPQTCSARQLPNNLLA